MADPHKHAAGKMSTEEVRHKLYDIIVEALGVDRDSVSDSANIVEDLNADSLDVVELVMVIEKEFNIAIPDEVAEKIVTVGDAIEHIRDALK